MEMFLAFADRLRISRVPAGEPINPHGYTCARLEVGQIGHPLPENISALRSRIAADLNHDLIVTYKLHFG